MQHIKLKGTYIGVDKVLVELVHATHFGKDFNHKSADPEDTEFFLLSAGLVGNMNVYLVSIAGYTYRCSLPGNIISYIHAPIGGSEGAFAPFVCT